MQPIPIQYTMEEQIINDKIETIYTFVVNMDTEGIQLKNALSFDLVYGFETTSDMSQREEGMAAVNGIFYDQYGRYIGGVVKDKTWLGYPNELTPMVAIDEENHVTIDEMITAQSFRVKKGEIQLNGVNQAAYYKEWVLYTPHYGKTTRISRESMNYVIVDNKVSDMIYSSDPVFIPENGYVISQVTDDQTPIMEIGESVTINTQTEPSISIQEAFQSGGWLVKDGEIVVKEEEPFIGYTNYPAPRTLFGITDENRVIIKVIDGRQAGYSIGVTGKEAAQIMLDAGCTDAVYLDGGASSTMVVNHQVINQPSSDEEREVAHALVFKMKEIKGLYTWEEKLFP